MATSKSLGDRYAGIAVVLLTVVALLVGWFYKGSVESRSLPFAADGIQAAVPAGWLQSQPGGGTILQARERASLGLPTTYTIVRQPMSADSGENGIISLLTLQHGQDLTAFRVLDQRAVTVGGREAYEITYAYVESDPNVTHADLPVVAQGVDYIFFGDASAVIVTYRASESEYEAGLARFHRFLNSVQY